MQPLTRHRLQAGSQPIRALLPKIANSSCRIQRKGFYEDNQAMHDAETPPQRATGPQTAQARNPLHGLTLENIVTQLADFYGWDDLGARIPIRCFTHDPSISSSLKFLRKTPWAREKVESLYLFMLRDQKRRSL